MRFAVVVGRVCAQRVIGRFDGPVIAANRKKDVAFRVELETVSPDAEIPLCFAPRIQREVDPANGVGAETLNPVLMQQEVEA